MGRVNRAHQSVFYCCNALGAALSELNVSCGDEVVVSEWENAKKMLVNNVGYMYDALRQLGSQRDMPFWQSNSTHEISSEANVYALNGLADFFVERVPDDENHRYKRTIAIAEKMVPDDTFAGLAYPTVANHGNAENWVLRTDWVAGNMSPKVAYFIFIEQANDSNFEFRFLDYASEFDSGIGWRGKGPTWASDPNCVFRLVYENGCWGLNAKDPETDARGQHRPDTA